jgi:mRNA interferase RelE/StbE
LNEAAPYQVRIPRNVAKAIKRLPPPDRLAVFKAIEALGKSPRPRGHAKLKLKDLGEYRIRVRDYRVRYDVDDEKRLVSVLAVKARGEAYRA